MADQITPPWFTQGMMQMAKLPNLMKPRPPQEQEPEGPDLEKSYMRFKAYPKPKMYKFKRLRPLGHLHPLHTVEKHGPRRTRHK